MELTLSGKNALVCGSSQGIGLSAAIELSKMGANVILLARNEERLQAAVARLSQSNGQKHAYFIADFSDSANVREAINQIQQASIPVHILINNTGGPAGGKLLDAPVSSLIDAFQMHLINNHLLVQAFAGDMQEVGFGRIVNIISTSVKQPIPGLGVSNTIRWAVAGWAKTLAGELGPAGITVNNILPGYTKTARLDSVISTRAAQQHNSPEAVSDALISTIPTRRFAEASEVGAAVAFLCSPAAASINGINLPVDGGNTGSL